MNIKNSKHIFATLLISLLFTQLSFANTTQEIDNEVNLSVETFKKEVPGGIKFLEQAKGYLVFPSVIKAGLIVGGKYDEGALLIHDKTAHYYEMTAASVGLQAGAQRYGMLIAFLSDSSLNNFIRSNGWEAGIDGTITIAEWGKSTDISSISYEKPIIAFIFDERGLMASISITGTKFRRIAPLSN